MRFFFYEDWYTFADINLHDKLYGVYGEKTKLCWRTDTSAITEQRSRSSPDEPWTKLLYLGWSWQREDSSLPRPTFIFPPLFSPPAFPSLGSLSNPSCIVVRKCSLCIFGLWRVIYVVLTHNNHVPGAELRQPFQKTTALNLRTDGMRSKIKQ